MRCLYCDEKIKKETLYSLFIEQDKLCNKCRKKLNKKIRHTKLDKYDATYFYDYDEMFKSLLLQFKECHDEALKDVFLYDLKDYINLRYFNYQILFVPSSMNKINERGFNHLELIFENIRLKRVTGLKMKDDLIQEGKDKIDRMKMLENYYYEGEKLDRVLVVDDVMTTGASLLGICKALDKKVSLVKLLILSIKK